MPAALSPDLLEKMDAYWRAANYLTVEQIYLQDNPLLETPLNLDIARFSTCQPQNLIRVSGSPCRWNQLESFGDGGIGGPDGFIAQARIGLGTSIVKATRAFSGEV